MAKNTDFMKYDHKISRVYDVSRAANKETVGKLIKILNVDHESVLLDIGCGTGNYSAEFQKTAKNVIGIDLSMAMIHQAHTKFPTLQLINGNATCFPFNSGMFDGAYAIQVLHHIEKKEYFLREVLRVLRKKAYFALHTCSHKQMRAFWFYHYFPKGLEMDIKRFLDVEEIVTLLGKIGFSNIGVEICYHDVVVANETPENYLDKSYRDGVSTFSFLKDEDIKSGCEKILEDIHTSIIRKIVHQYESQVENEVGGSTIIYGRKN